MILRAEAVQADMLSEINFAHAAGAQVPLQLILAQLPRLSGRPAQRLQAMGTEDGDRRCQRYVHYNSEYEDEPQVRLDARLQQNPQSSVQPDRGLWLPPPRHSDARRSGSGCRRG